MMHGPMNIKHYYYLAWQAFCSDRKNSETLTHHAVSHKHGTHIKDHPLPASLQEHLDLCNKTHLL